MDEVILKTLIDHYELTKSKNQESFKLHKSVFEGVNRKKVIDSFLSTHPVRLSYQDLYIIFLID